MFTVYKCLLSEIILYNSYVRLRMYFRKLALKNMNQTRLVDFQGCKLEGFKVTHTPLSLQETVSLWLSWLERQL